MAGSLSLLCWWETSVPKETLFPNGDEGVQEGRCLVLRDAPPSCACPSCASSSQAAALHWLVPKPPTGAASRASRTPLHTRGACSLCRGLTTWRP